MIPPPFHPISDWLREVARAGPAERERVAAAAHVLVDQLERLRGSPGTPIATYAYDGLNRRVRRALSDSIYESFYDEAWREVERRYEGDGDPIDQFAWDLAYVDRPIVRWHDAGGDGDVTDFPVDNTLYYLTDANQNVTGVWDADALAVAERYVYDPHGRTTVYSDDWLTFGTGSNVGNDRLFAGYVFDYETGNFYARTRYYHPTLATWLQRDFEGYIDGPNLYQYVNGDPAGQTDPFGLFGGWGGYGTPGGPKWRDGTTYLEENAAHLARLAERHMEDQLAARNAAMYNRMLAIRDDMRADAGGDLRERVNDAFADGFTDQVYVQWCCWLDCMKKGFALPAGVGAGIGYLVDGPFPKSLLRSTVFRRWMDTATYAAWRFDGPVGTVRTGIGSILITSGKGEQWSKYLQPGRGLNFLRDIKSPALRSFVGGVRAAGRGGAAGLSLLSIQCSWKCLKSGMGW